MSQFEKKLLGFDPTLEIKKYESNCAGYEDDTPIPQEKTKTTARVVLMQQTYLTEKWQMGEGYSHVQLLEGRRVIIDEAHAFFSRCEVQEQLTHCYFGKCEERMGKCPKAMKYVKKTDECPCSFSANVLPPNTRRFFTFTAPRNRAMSELKIDLPEDWLDFDSFMHIDGTKLWIKHLPRVHVFEKGRGESATPDAEGYYRHLNYIQMNTIGRHLRVELPDETQDVANTTLPCRCVKFCGFNIAPFEALKKATQIIYSTATPSKLMEVRMPKETRTINYRLSEPAKYPVTVCHFSEKISDGKIIDCLSRLNDPKTLVVHPRDCDSKILTTKFNRSVTRKRIACYSGGLYDLGPRSTEDQDKISDIRIVYAGAPILTGNDMDDRNIILLDLGIFPPISAVGIIDENDTRETLVTKIHEEINNKVLQICGRLYRGEIRRLLFLFHNCGKIPKIVLDEKITDLTEVTKEEIMSCRQELEIESLVENITRVIEGEPIIDHKSEIFDENYDSLPRKVAKATKEVRKEAKEAAKVEKTEAKVSELAKAGASWRDTVKKLNISRLDEAIQTRMKIIYDSNYIVCN
jgi:hypothetical protein